MKTIIVATNYSNEANNAVTYAAELASHLNSKLVLFNSFELSVHASNALLPGSSISRLIAENNNTLNNIALGLSGKYGIAVDHVSRASDLMEELDFQVKRLNADLVVMGMKRCSFRFCTVQLYSKCNSSRKISNSHGAGRCPLWKDI